MRAVAHELGTTTSTVSQQIAVLAQEAGTTLIEPDGRRVRLTPAGRPLAEHAPTLPPAGGRRGEGGGTRVIEPDGRRVRLTPAGRRLAEHAVTILAAVDAARLDLDPAAE